MSIILRKTTSAKQTVHRTWQFVTIHRTKLEQAQRQVAIGMDVVFVQHYMARAVHRFNAVLLHTRSFVAALVNFKEVHVFVVEVVMTWSLPNVRLVNMRSNYLFIATRIQIATKPFLQQTNNTRTLRWIKWQTYTCLLIKHKQAQFTTKFAVITLFCLFQIMQVGS